ncbi:CTP-dependent riboflavin kinase [Candidatus Micrarchaeota archaeon]|nr:CTP-dependent riboflavin kinase [Candidatus Micrarchaeota archaeon]
MMKKTHLDLLLLLLRAGGGTDKVFATTNDIARELGISQQSISRWVIQLERAGFVERGHSSIWLTSKALDELMRVYFVMKSSFEKEFPVKLFGTVVSGLKDGRYYLSLPHYARQFRKKLGFTPYRGTLNVVMEDRNKKLMLNRMKGITVDGFSIGNRVLGKVKCFPVLINGKVRGALVLPERSHYSSDIIEIVSQHNLREKLKLKDGSRVNIELLNSATRR